MESRWQKADLRALSWNKQAKTPPPVHKENQAAAPVGLFYPVYGFSPPWVILAFILSWANGRGGRVFLVNTRGAIKTKRHILWGVSGLALWLPWLILTLKGYRVSGVLAVDAASNWITAHPGPSWEAGKFMLDKGRHQLDELAHAVLNKRPYYDRKIFYYIPIDLFLAPLSCFYLLLARWVWGKLFVASSKCNLCGECAEACPVGAISLNPRPAWKRTCLSCMRCLNFCPQKAIYPAHLPLLVGLVAGFTALLLVWVSSGFCLGIISSAIAFVLGVMLFYPVMKYLAKRPQMEKMVSFSVYWPFYRYWKSYKKPAANGDNLDSGLY